jgi:hypothetical protein
LYLGNFGCFPPISFFGRMSSVFMEITPF